jgi:hypothetical protein
MPTLLKPDRRIIRPGWDEPPIDRRRARSGWWGRLLSGRAATTRLAPGACCGCGGGGGITCSPCTLPQANLTLSWVSVSNSICPPGSTTLVYTPSLPPNLGVYWVGSGGDTGACCNPNVAVGVSCGTDPVSDVAVIQWWSVSGTTYTLVCEASDRWTVTSCSPLIISMTTAIGESNHCGGNCSSLMDGIKFTLTA